MKQTGPSEAGARVIAAGLPYLVADTDMSDASWVGRLRAQTSETGRRGLYLLLRQDGVPSATITCTDLAQTTDDELRRAAKAALANAAVAGGGVGARPSVTVCICTYGRPSGLRSLFDSLLHQEDSEFDVLVVDNTAIPSAEVQAVVEMYAERLDVRLAHQPIKGLSNARNRAVEEARSDVVAWIDDDEEADVAWIQQIRRAFADSTVDCVCGRMIPARIENEAHLLFEQFGGHNKGAAARPHQFHRSTLGRRLYYPLPAFGSGGNMAIRTEVIRGLPQFDAFLGAGAPCPGGEDTLFFTQLLEAGKRLIFEPSVVTWHHHRETEDELTQQLMSYGRGLGGYYAALLLGRPSRLLALMALLPRAIIDQMHPNSLRNNTASARLTSLRVGNRRAVIDGAATYFRLRRAQRSTASRRVGP